MTEIKPHLNQTQKILDNEGGMYDPLYKPIPAKTSPTCERVGNAYVGSLPYKELGPQDPIEAIPDEIIAEMAPGRTIDDYEVAIISTIRRLNRWFVFKQWCGDVWDTCKIKFEKLAFWKNRQPLPSVIEIPCWQSSYIAEGSLRNMERILKCYNQFEALFSFEKDETLSATWTSFILSIKDFRHYDTAWVASEKNRYKQKVADRIASLPPSLRRLLPVPNNELEISKKQALFDETSEILEQALDAYYQESQKIEPQDIESFFNSYAKTASI